MADEFRMRWDGRITPTFLGLMAQIIALAFAGGTLWQSIQRDIADNKEDLAELRKTQTEQVNRIRTELQQLRTTSTDVAVLKTDVSYIRESLSRIEQAISQQRRTELR